MVYEDGVTLSSKAISDNFMLRELAGRYSGNLVPEDGEWTDGSCMTTGGSISQNWPTLSMSPEIPISPNSTYLIKVYTVGNANNSAFCVKDAVGKSITSRVSFETIDQANKIYKIKTPEDAASLWINLYIEEKESAFVRQLYTKDDKLKIEWLKVPVQQLDDSGIEISDTNLLDTCSWTDYGYRGVNGKATSETIHSAIIDGVLEGDVLFVYNGQNVQGNSSLAPSYYVFVGEDDKSVFTFNDYTSGPAADHIEDIGGNIFMITIPPGCTRFYYTIGDDRRSVAFIRKKQGFSFKNLEILEENISTSVLLQLLKRDAVLNIIPSYERLMELINETQIQEKAVYHLWESINKPIEFKGKKLHAFGDSITSGTASPGLISAGKDSYISKFCEYAGAILTNHAIGGQCIADNADYGAQYCILKRVKEQATNQDDIIWIAGGTNDFNTGKPLGNFDSTDTATFYGALRNLCEWLKTNTPDATIIFVTPIPYTKPESEYKNHVAPLDAYRSAIYDIATLYEYNVVDGNTLGMPRMPGDWNNEMCDDADGCHPTIKGHKLMARNLAGKLL